MTRIDDTAISSSYFYDHAQLNLGVDIRFTGVDMFEGQTGAAQFTIECTLWESDWFFDDHITGKQVILEPGSIQELTGVNILFDLSWAELSELDNTLEGSVEIFGEFTLRKNNEKLGPSVNGHKWRIDIPEVIP
jgi:hypothetical protein